MARRRSRYGVPGRRAGSVLLVGGRSRQPRGLGGRKGQIGPRRRWGPVLLGAAVLAMVALGIVVWRSLAERDSGRRAAAERFISAWARGDRGAMWQALTPRARARYPEARFVTAYRASDRAAGVRAVSPGRLRGEHDGTIAVDVRVRTADFGTLHGTISLPVSGSGSSAGVDWDPSLRLPGLHRGERVRRRVGVAPPRAPILAADGTRLDATPLGASIAGQADPRPTGLERIYNLRLAGHPAEQLLFGARVIARAPLVRGRSLQTTIRPRLMSAAAVALGQQLGGVAVIRPRDGAVQALVGLAVSAPQPPGSTFKIITTAAALQSGIATPSSTYPIRTAATLSGVELRNASDEACGGSLTEAFTVSCNSVFAPLGARLGARRLVAMARAFGWGEQPRIPAAKPSTISRPSQLRDSLAVGAAAIGQDRDLATPLQMASVGATIALEGRRAEPRIATIDRVRTRSIISPTVARQVRAMMVSVVHSGTGTAAAIPGVEVAGKTGTAELRPNSTNPKDADAWFVAFAPAQRPEAAVAVMLVGAGFGGTTAAPIARQVLEAALTGR
jgi:penicillin-binding protein A